MRELTRILPRESSANKFLTLPFDKRQRSRFRTRLDDGEEVGVYLGRGTLLRDGDRLGDSEGCVVAIKAAPELVSTVHGSSPQELARIAYHLGNRHVNVQIGETWLRYLHDHVLDDLVQQFGLNVVVEQAPFEPEAGAYQSGHHHTHEHN